MVQSRSLEQQGEAVQSSEAKDASGKEGEMWEMEIQANASGMNFAGKECV